MARRGFGLILTIFILVSLVGCMAAARTANVLSDEEILARAAVEDERQEPIVEITAMPTQEVTPFLSTPSPPPTITPTPSPTPSPTPTPTPAYTVKAIDDKRAYLNAGSANLRKGPGTTYDIIRELEREVKLTVTGACGEWLRVRSGDDTGFVLAEFVEYGTLPTPKPSPTPTKKPTPTPATKPTATPKPPATATQKSATAEPTSGGGGFTDANGFTAEELLLLAQVVHEEAKGTSLEAQMAVANAIYNRVKSPKFPNTVEGVLFQKSQYTVIKSREQIGAVKPSEKAIEAVRQIFVENNTLLPSDVMYFRAASRGTDWGSSYKYYDTFGNNCFFIYIG